jgi:hypothetical protein
VVVAESQIDRDHHLDDRDDKTHEYDSAEAASGHPEAQRISQPTLSNVIGIR